MSPCVCPKKVLALDGGRYVAEDGLNVALNSVLSSLFVGCGALVCVAVVGTEDGGFGGSECGEVVAAENSWCVATGCEEVEHSFQMIEEDFLVAGLDRVVKPCPPDRILLRSLC